MRKIKLRSVFFRHDTNEFSHFTYWGFINHKEEYDIKCFCSPSSCNFAYRKYEDQYTGLKDKNGKEIYGDSDILMGDEGVRYMLKWEDTAGYKLYFWDDGKWDWDEDIDDIYDYTTQRIDLEVIGTIYENPELLK